MLRTLQQLTMISRIPSLAEFANSSITTTVHRNIPGVLPSLRLWQRFSSSIDDDSAPEAAPHFDVNKKSATELVWPMSRHQEKFAARVYRAFSAVLAQDSFLRQELIDNIGFTIKEVRVSPDHAKAFILWDCYNSQPAVASRTLRSLTPKLKAAIARAMAAKNVPRLEFRFDKASEAETELERIFERLKQEN